jgi:DNA-binding transcriptional regulator/RsmH inhibitor MraZ
VVESWAQLPLPRLFDDVEPSVPERWSFAVVTVEPSGRVTLPTGVRDRFAQSAVVRAAAAAEVVVLSTTGAGRRVRVDGRGRVVVPCWLRDAIGPSGALVIGACRGDGCDAMVLLAPARLLCRWADALVGEGS